MSDIKIGDKVIGFKGINKVMGTVVDVKEGHAYVKAPVCGVYAPMVSAVPMNKVRKLNEGKMKAHHMEKDEKDDEAGMSDYMNHVQTSAPFDADEKPATRTDQFGNKIKLRNVAKHLAKQGMRGVKKEEVEDINVEESIGTNMHPAMKRFNVEVIQKNGKTKSHKNVPGDSAEHAAMKTKHKYSYWDASHISASEVREGVEQIDELTGIKTDMGKATKFYRGITNRIKKKAKAGLDTTSNERSQQNASHAIANMYKEEVEQIDEMDKEMPLSREQRDNMAKQKPAEYAKLYNKVSPEMRKKLNLPAKLPEEVEQVEEGYKGRRAFGSAYDKTHDPFQDSKRRFKRRELEHELAHEDEWNRRTNYGRNVHHHDNTPHDVHIDGKKWKTFGSAAHAHNVANKLSISGKKASVHKTPDVSEKAPPGWEGTVKAMKKHPEIDNPFALAWWMKNKGAKSHKGKK